MKFLWEVIDSVNQVHRVPHVEQGGTDSLCLGCMLNDSGVATKEEIVSYQSINKVKDKASRWGSDQVVLANFDFIGLLHIWKHTVLFVLPAPFRPADVPFQCSIKVKNHKHF